MGCRMIYFCVMTSTSIKPNDPVTEYQKYFPPSFTLETPRVLLRLISQNDVPDLSLITKNKEIWKYFTKDLSDDTALHQWIDEALAERAQGKRMPFTIFDKDTKTICGSTSYGNISFFDKRVEIGWSWLGVDYMSTGVNRHAKFALLSFAFEAMKMERVEVKTDNLNERAKAALLKIGMRPEGVLRSHMQMHSDRRRDSVYFSILKDEWEETKTLFFGSLI
jgi:RimJ/RimL family protein N-acetyltransferase